MARKAAQTNLATGASQYGDDGWLADPEMDWKEMLDVLRAINDEVEAEDRRRARAAGVPLGAKGGARASATKRIAAARVAERELARQQLRAEADYALSCMDGTAAAARNEVLGSLHNRKMWQNGRGAELGAAHPFAAAPTVATSRGGQSGGRVGRLSAGVTGRRRSRPAVFVGS